MCELQGAVPLSGPQDDCKGCPENTKYWIDNPYKTKLVTGFAHSDESQYRLIANNWARMAKAASFKMWGKKLKTTDVQAIDLVQNLPDVASTLSRLILEHWKHHFVATRYTAQHLLMIQVQLLKKISFMIWSGRNLSRFPRNMPNSHRKNKG